MKRLRLQNGRSRNGFSRDRRGAAIVEFVVVIVPLSLAFFSIAQISMIFAAKLMMRHAAIAAVRAYSVIATPNPGTNGSSPGDPSTAGQIALGPWYTSGGKSISDVSFAFTSLASTTQPYGYYDLDTVTATGTYQCTVPLGAWVACGGGWSWGAQNPHSNFNIPLGPYTASFPHQGARYLNP